MSKYQRRTVYCADLGYMANTYYKSHGVMMDRLKQFAGKYWRDVELSQETVFELKDVEDRSAVMRRIVVHPLDDEGGIQYDEVIFRSLWYTEAAFTYYFQSEYPEHLKNIGVGDRRFANIESVTYEQEMYDEPTFPMSVFLQRDTKKGDNSYFCHIQTAPNWDGLSSPGKIFFPDKSWVEQGIYAGEAKATIKFQKDNYGIILGEMLPLAPCPTAALGDYLKEHWIGSTENIHTIDIPTIGPTYCKVSRDSCDVIEAFVIPKGVTCIRDIDMVSVIPIDLGADEIQKRTLSVESVLPFLFCESQGKDFDIVSYIDEHFTPCEFYNMHLTQFPKYRNLMVNWVQCEVPGEDGLLDWAGRVGVFYGMLLEGYNICCVGLDPYNYRKLCDLSRQELDYTFEAASEINTKANETIRAKLKKGSLRLKI